MERVTLTEERNVDKAVPETVGYAAAAAAAAGWKKLKVSFKKTAAKTGGKTHHRQVCVAGRHLFHIVIYGA